MKENHVRQKVLFLSSDNSCRSQMAEGWLGVHFPDIFEPYSAGITKGVLSPYAVTVMAEVGVDPSKNHSKTVDELQVDHFDVVISLSIEAIQHCPALDEGVSYIAIPFDSPSSMTEGLTDEAAILDCYRRVRDDLELFTQKMA
jgi:arsenate reductase